MDERAVLIHTFFRTCDRCSRIRREPVFLSIHPIYPLAPIGLSFGIVRFGRMGCLGRLDGNGSAVADLLFSARSSSEASESGGTVFLAWNVGRVDG